MMWCSAWSTVCCRVHLCVVFVPGALRWVMHGWSQRLPAERSYPTKWHTWEVGRRGGGRFESRRLCNARVSCFASHCACACRACVRRLKHDVRLRQRATVYRVSAQDMVQCVVNRLLSCPLVCGFCAWGAALGNARKVSTPPSPKGRYPASRRTRHSCRPPGRPCRESPGLFVLSLSHSLEVQQTVGCQSTRATSVDRPAMKPFSATARGVTTPY